MQTPLPLTSRQASKSRKKSRKLHRDSVLNFPLDEASVVVIINTMSVLVVFAILLTYNCSAHIMLPWVQQLRSDAFSPALKCRSVLPKNRQILLTGCRHTQHHTKTTSASLLRINLPSKHVRRKPTPIYYPTMPVNQTVLVRSLDAKRCSIVKEDGSGPTPNKKGEVLRAR
jgi:hypothetical protein